jgi:protein TonB
MHKYEKQSRQAGLVATVSLHAILLLLFLFVMATSPQENTNLEFGVAVNYGTDNEGYGKVQSYNPANDSQSKEVQKASSQQEVKQTQFAENKTVQPETQTDKVKELTTEDKESPAVAKEVAKEAKNTQQPQIDNNATLNKGTTGGIEDGKSNKGGGNNNGNKEGTVGDMGKPNGDINADALLGNGGTGGGTSLEMSGWVWDEKPLVNDNSADTGKIIFEIKIDEDGEVISVKNIYSTVSRTVANLYEKAVYDLTFSPTNEGMKPAVTVGKITFVITAK